MNQANIVIPRQTLVAILKSQPEKVLISLFEDILVKSDTSPLTKEEEKEIEWAIEDYNRGETIEWKK